MKNILLILTTITTLVSCNKGIDFDKKAKEIYNDLNALYIVSSKGAEITEIVWSMAIRDKRYALSNSNSFDEYYVSDFNEALASIEKLKDKIEDMYS